MTLVIVISNILVSMPINDWLTWGAFSFPLVYLVIDLSNRSLGPTRARKVAWISLPIAVLASWYFADWRIACASGIAFIAGQMLDITFFNFLRKQSWWKAPWVGSIIGSIVDTILFFSIAFAGTDLNWMQLAIGDISIKWLMASILLVPYRMIIPMIGNWKK
ncbi:VUT family protein [Candidatus Gracilibacteria bacterium]|nr:VUT family protein [Candidatus Gracilibacteria bacterium]